MSTKSEVNRFYIDCKNYIADIHFWKLTLDMFIVIRK